MSCHARRRGRSEGRRPPSPPIEQENPFIKEFYYSSLDYKDLKQVKPSQSKKLLEKVNNNSPKSISSEKSGNVDKLRKKRKQNGAQDGAKHVHRIKKRRFTR